MLDFVHLHPIFVHFPIALLVAGFVCELIGIFTGKDFFRKAGLYLLITGAVTFITAYYSGDFASEKLGGDEGPFHQIINVHEEAATLTLWLVLGTAALRLLSLKIKKQGKVLLYASIALYLVAIGSMINTGYTGGQLVYKHAIGVQTEKAAIPVTTGSTDN